jgi:hypothetical protein
LGVCYQFGRGVDLNVKTAAMYYERASDHGDDDGSNNFGICLEFGKGIDADISRAAEYYRKSADQGHAGAQNNFGFCLEHGIGVDIDLEKAFSYYQLSADQGHTGAAFHCALCLHYGIGVEIDLSAAVEYYAEAHCDPSISMGRDSFRCLRALRQTPFVLRHFPELGDFRSVIFESCLSQRPLVRPLFVYQYILKESDRRPRPPEKSVIGCGGFSTVFLCNHRNGTGQFVIKRFEGSGFNPSQLMREVQTLVTLNHPCIVRIRNFFLPSKSEPAEIHMEYASNGSLDRIFNLVRQGAKPSFWTPTGIGIIICGIVLGMRFMHAHDYIHQDLKPSNILLDGNGRTLIADFGTSRCKAVDHTPTHDTGTPHYAAPELFEEDSRTEKVDVFSFGLIVFEILVGYAVFAKGLMPAEIIRSHKKGERPIIPNTVEPVMKTLIERCWSPNPSNRPSFNDILQSIDSNDFRIIPEADSTTIGLYVRGVRDWEQMRDFKNSAPASD